MKTNGVRIDVVTENGKIYTTHVIIGNVDGKTVVQYHLETLVTAKNGSNATGSKGLRNAYQESVKLAVEQFCISNNVDIVDFGGGSMGGYFLNYVKGYAKLKVALQHGKNVTYITDKRFVQWA